MSNTMQYRKTLVLNIRLKNIPTKYLGKQKLAQGERNSECKLVNLIRRWSFQYKTVSFQNKQTKTLSVVYWWW